MKAFKSLVFFALLLLAVSCCNRGNYEYLLSKEKSVSKQWIDDDKKIEVSGVLNVVDSVKIALQFNQELKAVMQEVTVAKGREIEVVSHLFPKVVALGNYSHLDERPSLIFAGQKYPLGYLDNYSVDVQVRQPIFHGGALRAQAYIAGLMRFMTDEKVRGQTQKTIFETIKTYYDILLTKNLVYVYQQALLSAQKHLKIAENRRTVGMASQYEVLRFEVEMSNIEAEIIRQKNRLSLSEKSFLKTLGVSLQSQFDLQNVFAFIPEQINYDKALMQAFDNRFDLRLCILSVENQKKMLTIAKSEFLPKVNGVFSHKWGRPDPHTSTLDTWGKQWTAFLSFEFPIFESGKRIGSVMKERASLKEKEFQLEDMRQTIALNIEQAILSLEDAQKFVLSQMKDMTRAKEGLRLAELNYKEGLATEVEVTDALSSMTHSESLYYQAIYQHLLSKLNLQMALGTLGITTVENQQREEPDER